MVLALVESEVLVLLGGGFALSVFLQLVVFVEVLLLLSIFHFRLAVSAQAHLLRLYAFGLTEIPQSSVSPALVVSLTGLSVCL